MIKLASLSLNVSPHIMLVFITWLHVYYIMYIISYLIVIQYHISYHISHVIKLSHHTKLKDKIAGSHQV